MMLCKSKKEREKVGYGRNEWRCTCSKANKTLAHSMSMSKLQLLLIQLWLFEHKDMRIEGRIIGFDEYMNLVLEDAEKINCNIVNYNFILFYLLCSCVRFVIC